MPSNGSTKQPPTGEAWRNLQSPIEGAEIIQLRPARPGYEAAPAGAGAPGAPSSSRSTAMRRARLAAAREALETAFKATAGIGKLEEGLAMADVTREEIELMREADRARTDAKFAEMIGKIDVIGTRIEGKFDTMDARMSNIEASTRGTKTQIWLAFVGGLIAVAGVLFTIAQYGGQMVSVGFNASEIADRAAKSAIERSIEELKKQQK